MSAITAPAVNMPPSRNAWKPTMFTVTGSISSTAAAVLPDMTSPSARAKTTDMIYMMYFALYSALMKPHASGVLYISAVGSGKIPSEPNIGETINKQSTTFKIILNIFILRLYNKKVKNGNFGIIYT